MRKLLIDGNIRSFAVQYATELNTRQKNIVADLEELRDNVIKYNTGINVKAVEGYINLLISDYPAVLTLEPNGWDMQKYDDVLKLEPGLLTTEVIYSYTKDQIKKGKVVKPGRPLKDKFYERIMFCLRYNDARSILGSIHQKMGLRACFYCNIMPTDSDDKGHVYYEMDHLKPQSKYPFLGTCFYNLQPCDPACNKRKQAKPCDSHLYVNDEHEELSPFLFVPQVVELDKTRGSYSCMKIVFVDNQGVFSPKCKQYDETFDIINHYAAHYRDVERVYWNNAKSGVMGMREHYRASVEYEPTEDEIIEYCLGFPLDERLIHEEPLRKLKIDTVKQLKKNGVLKV